MKDLMYLDLYNVHRSHLCDTNRVENYHLIQISRSRPWNIFFLDETARLLRLRLQSIHRHQRAGVNHSNRNRMCPHLQIHRFSSYASKWMMCFTKLVSINFQMSSVIVAIYIKGWWLLFQPCWHSENKENGQNESTRCRSASFNPTGRYLVVEQNALSLNGYRLKPTQLHAQTLSHLNCTGLHAYTGTSRAHNKA